MPVSRVKLKEVLMEPRAPGVKDPYFIIRGESGQSIVIITSGKNGSEFNKTYGKFYRYPAVELLYVAFGQGVLLMQRNDDSGEAKEVRVAGLRAGVSIEVPAGYGYCLVNIGKNYLIVVENASDSEDSQVMELLLKRRGFAYFIVDKKGEVGFEQNSSYRLHPQIATY